MDSKSRVAPSGAIKSPWLAECQSPLLLKVYHGQRVIEESRWSALVGREGQGDTRGKAVRTSSQKANHHCYQRHTPIRGLEVRPMG